MNCGYTKMSELYEQRQFISFLPPYPPWVCRAHWSLHATSRIFLDKLMLLTFITPWLLILQSLEPNSAFPLPIMEDLNFGQRLTLSRQFKKDLPLLSISTFQKQSESQKLFL